MEYPNLSILTPTYNRHNFLKLSVYNVKCFDYPHDKLTWEILDDGQQPFINPEELQDVKTLLNPIKVKYTRYNVKHLTIGEKRNKLIKDADNNTFAFMDDDDIYMSSYLKYSVELLLKRHKRGLVGSPEMLFVFPYNDFQMSLIRCPAKRQIHEATMVSTRKYIKSMGWFNKSSKGEGASVIDFNENNVTKSDISKVMICVAHKNNTIDKEKFLKNKIDAPLFDPYTDILKDVLKMS